jgi:hypothetical protein
MKEDYNIVKEVPLNNNCPECFSKQGLQLTFMQKSIDTAFYKSVTNEVSHKMACNNCNSIIYPERWTDDIERVFEYQKKAFEPKKTAFQLKKITWLIIILIAIIITSVTITLFL